MNRLFRAFVFDLDGTLADSVESIAYSANQAIEECGLRANEVERYKEFAGDGAAKMLERSLIAAGDTELHYFEQVQRRYKELFSENCMYQVKVYDGIYDTISVLKEGGMKLGVLSNKPDLRAIDVVEALFGRGYFDKVQGQTDNVPRKPSPAGALKMAGELGLQPAQCIYVGDTNTDMLTGKRAGMFTVGVLWGFRDRKELEENGADLIISHPCELLDVIK